MFRLSFGFFIIAVLTSPPVSSAEEITFDSTVQVKKDSQSSFSELKEGEVLKLDAGESALVSTTDGIPLLVYSATNKSAKMRVTQANMNNVAQERIQKAVERATNEIVAGLRRTDELLQKRDYTQALAVISPLKDKYRKIPSIYFMSGTIFYLLANKASAIEDLESGLLLDPENQTAKKLLQKLKGSQ